MDNKVLIVFNPCAGKSSARSAQDDIIRTFRDYGFRVTEKTTTCVGDATEIVKNHLGDHALVVCCGGDGTFNETVNGMIALNSKVPILYYPMGSTNDLANTIGVTKDIRKSIELFLSGNIVSYDIGQLNDRHFTYVAAFGTGTEVSFKTSQKLKNRFGHFAYILDAFVLHFPQQVKSLKPHTLTITHDGGTISGRFSLGVILNTNEFSGIFKIDRQRDIKLNDGLFDVLLVRNVKGLADAFHLLGKLIRQDYDGDQILVFSTSRLTVEGEDALTWTIDGEYGGRHDAVEFNVLPQQIRLVAPEGDFFLPEPDAQKKPVK